MGIGRGVYHTGPSAGERPSAGVLVMAICPGRATSNDGISVAARDVGNVYLLRITPFGIVEPSCPGPATEVGPGVSRDGVATPMDAGGFTVP